MISRKVSIKLKIHVFPSFIILPETKKRKEKKRQPHEAIN